MIPVLIVSGGGFQGLGLLESLQRLAHVAPIVADVYQDNVTRYLSPRYVQVPPLADEAAFTDALLALVRERGVRAVFPATAHELPLLARLRDRFARAGAQVAVSDPSLVEILLDKQATHRFLLAHGLPVQAPVDPEDHDFSRPLFGKPRHGWGGTGTVLARSPAEARHADARPGGAPLLWFPYLERFEEYSLDLAISPSGYVSPLVLRQRLRTTGGYAAISRTASRAPLRALARRIADVLAASGGRGILNVQFIVADDGEPFVSDVNPRFGTSAVHALAEGVNLPGFFLEDQAPGPDADAPRRAARTVRYLETIAVPLLRQRPDAVVFDLDDTLVDHKLWMADRLAAAYDAVARGWADPDAFALAALQAIDEGERRFLIDRVCETLGWEERQRQALLEAYRRAPGGETPLYPDVAPALEALRDAGLRLAVLTDNPVATQRSKLERSPVLRDLAAFFSREAGAEKPAAVAFEAAARGLGLSPDRLCMVGDNLFRDALGAIRSGYACAFVLHRDGAFIHPHRSLAARIPLPGDIHHVRDLTIVRESLLSR